MRPPHSEQRISLRFRTRRLLAIAVGALATSACDQQPPAPSPAATAVASAAPASSASAVASAAAPKPKKPSRPERPLNVIVLTIDSLRADMPWTGYERKIAPNLTKLAAESVVYTNGYSVSSYTAKSVGAMLTGRYPSTLYRTGWFFTGYSKANTFFTELLQEAGIRTMGGHAHMYFKRGKNLEQGFDVWEITPGITFDAQTDNHVTSEKMTKLAIEMLEAKENTSKQFFMWLHYMDPHDVYVKHKDAPDWGRKNRDRYDTEVFHTDKHVGLLLAWCEKQPWWKNTALIISSDHGEAFGEHKMYKHAFEVWEVLTRVPILVKAPGIEPRKIAERRSQIDIAPTVMDLMGQKLHDGFVGKSWVPELYGAKPDVREPIVLDLPEDSHNPPRRAVIRGDWKLIVYGKGWKYALYNIKDDPGEEKDLSKTDKKQLETMKALFDSTWDKIPSIQPYGGMKLKAGGKANGPMGPPKPKEADDKKAGR